MKKSGIQIILSVFSLLGLLSVDVLPSAAGVFQKSTLDQAYWTAGDSPSKNSQSINSPNFDGNNTITQSSLDCTYYVGLDGDDANSGVRSDQAWATFKHALSQLTPGDTLCILNGTYHQSLDISRSGTPGERINIRSMSDGEVIIEGVDLGVRVLGHDYVTIRGVVVQGGSQGFLVRDSQGITLDQVGVYGVRYVGIWFREGIDGFVLSNCRVENMTGTDTDGWGIRVSDTGDFIDKGVIRDCVVKHGWRAGLRVEKVKVDLYDNWFEGWGGYSARDHGAYIGNPAPVPSDEPTIIEGNIFKSNNHGFGLKVSSFYSQGNIIIRNNVFIDNGVKDGNCCDGGLSIEWGNDDVKVYNNTFYENRNHAINISTYNYKSGRFTTNVKVMNNIFYSTQAALFLVMDDSVEGLEVDHNCYYTTNNVKFRTRINPSEVHNYYSLEDWQDNNVADWIDDHSMFINPLMVDPADGDFHLQAESICIDAGVILAEVPHDYDGFSRPQGSGYDIGAFEYSGEIKTFADVPFDHPYHDYIEVLYQVGYTAGCSTDPLMYCPERPMSRAESAVFLERGIHGAEYDPPDPTVEVFDDVALDAWYANWAYGLWEDGYTAGCGTDPLIYCPDQGHTRAEGCVFYLRMMYGADYEPPDPAGYFADVDPELWYAKWVDAAWDAGIAEPCATEPELLFCPEEGLTRAVAAYMMVRAKMLDVP